MPIYLKVGNLQGAVTSGPYKGWIEVDHYDWGFTIDVQSTVGATGDRVGSGKVTPNDLHMNKVMDDTTTLFMLQSLQGKNNDTATLAVTLMASTDGSSKYMEYKMENVMCSHFTTSASANSGKPQENVALNFTKIEFNQFLKDAAGNERVVRGGFDFTKAAKV